MDLSKHLQPNSSTRAYVDFLHQVAADPTEVRVGVLAVCRHAWIWALDVCSVRAGSCGGCLSV